MKKQRLKIYIGCSLTQAPETFKKSIELLKDKLRAEYYILDFVGLVKGTPKDVFEWDTNCVKTCDLFVADCTHPAIGLGYELGIALSVNKPILVVAHSDARLSRIVQGMHHPKFTFARYDSIFDVVTLIKSKLKFL